MVRHECAEALGSVGGKEVEEELARCDDVCGFHVSFQAGILLKFPQIHPTTHMIRAFNPNRYLDPGIPAVLRESCVVALDMNDYNASKEFQYANGLVSVKAE